VILVLRVIAELVYFSLFLSYLVTVQNITILIKCMLLLMCYSMLLKTELIITVPWPLFLCYLTKHIEAEVLCDCMLLYINNSDSAYRYCYVHSSTWHVVLQVVGVFVTGVSGADTVGKCCWQHRRCHCCHCRLVTHSYTADVWNQPESVTAAILHSISSWLVSSWFQF